MTKKKSTLGWVFEFNPNGISRLEFTPEDYSSMSDEQIDKVIDKFSSAVQANTVSSTSTTAANHTANGLTISELIDLYNKSRKLQHQDDQSWAPDRGDEIKFRRLRELLGQDRAVAEIARDDANYVLASITQLPRNTATTRGLDIHTVLNACRSKDDYEKLSAVQVNNHITLYSSLFEWALNNDKFTGRNPFIKLRINESKRRKNNTRREMFTREDLKRIFLHEIFTDFQSARARNSKLKPYRYWTPIIALYTGARPCEISSLYLSDIISIDELWFFDFNANMPDKCSKSYNSIRKTPIHPHIIKLGLIDYITELKSTNSERLFPELKFEDKDGYARYLNERFVDSVLRPLGLYQSGRKVFYSFRHTLSTELHRLGMSQLHREWLIGREAEGKSVGDEFYVKPDELPRLHNLLSKVDFSAELISVAPWPKPKNIKI